MATKKVKTAESVSIGEVSTPATAPAKGKHSSAHRKPARVGAPKSSVEPAVTRPADSRKSDAEAVPAISPEAAKKSASSAKSTRAKKVTAAQHTPAQQPPVGRASRSKKAVSEAPPVAPEAIATAPAVEPSAEPVIVALAAAASALAASPREVTTEPAAPARIAEPAALQTPSPESLREEIARLAYHLWVDGGCRHGRDHEDWAEAERQVLSRYTVR